MDTLSKIELLIVRYRATIETAETTISSQTEALIPKAVRFASAFAMIDTYKSVITDLEALLNP